MRTVYSTSRLFVDKDVFDIIYLYLLETEENGYELVFNFQNQEKKKLISDEKVFDKKTRKKIVKTITIDDLNEIIDIDLLDEEKIDLIDKLQGNF